MTTNHNKTLARAQLVEIKALAATMLECSQHLSTLFARRHPSLTDAEFMIKATHHKIHLTLRNLGIEP